MIILPIRLIRPPIKLIRSLIRLIRPMIRLMTAIGATAVGVPAVRNYLKL